MTLKKRNKQFLETKAGIQKEHFFDIIQTDVSTHCEGVMGKLFGHKFVPMETSKAIKTKLIIVCQRCGKVIK